MATVKALVVAGGGGGGGVTDSSQGGGGGSGGYIYNSAFTITPGTFSVTVGGGGAINTNGQDSVFSSLTAVGGGEGGSSRENGGNGGSGGGAGGLSYGSTSGGTATSGQGNNGGSVSSGGGQYAGAGGGGSGSVGSNPSTALNGANGGSGTLNPITGSGYLCGGGGGGGVNVGGNGGSSVGGKGSSYYDGNATSGATNTGSGGGGGYYNPGIGGSGIVQIAYKSDGSDGIGVASTGGTVTTVGLYTVHTFTSSGTFVANAPTPVATTQAVSSIDITTAIGNGDITSDGGYVVTERGICWGTSADPTIAGSKATSAGTTGAFTASMTGLTENTLYHVRAYATNALGTSYGADVTFTTLSLNTLDLIKDISGIEGSTYAVSLVTTVSAGSLTVKLGTTGDTLVISTTGTHVLQGVYGGLSGLIISQSADFVGTVDNVMWVLVTGDTAIDWALSTVTNLFPINSSVTFRRIEDKEITRFNLYRYLDLLFKDLDAYVTVTLTEEANDLSSSREKTFIVGNVTGNTSPFVKKRISMLSKNQAIRIGLSNNKLNEAFTISQFALTGFKEPRKLYKLSKIISI